MSQSPAPRRPEILALLVVGAALFVWSGINPVDRTTWILEVAPIVIAVPLLAATARRFPLTPLAYRLIFVHALILMLGGHYTYAQVPLGFWMQSLFGFTRNHYDRIGHFAQGFVPAVIAREILTRRSPLKPGQWLFFIVLSVCLAISACYEIHRMVVDADRWRFGRGVSRHAGRSVRHAGGHVHGADRRHRRADFAAAPARSPDRPP